MSPFANGFRGTAGGAVQTTYSDQPAGAVAGMLAFASENSLIDAIYVGETNGVRAGAAVKLEAVTDAVSGQVPNSAIHLPEADDAATVFAGIVLFDEAMQSDENGVPGWAAGRMARLLRHGRAGGRVWVAVKDAIVITNGVFMVTTADNAGTYALGDLTDVDLGGGAAGVAEDISAYARWVVGTSGAGLALLELF